MGVCGRLITHDEFRVLCAISTSGSLTEEERSSLEEHLLVCFECRKAAQEYDAVARIVMPSLVPDFPTEVGELPAGWSEENTKQELLRRLDLKKPSDRVPLLLSTPDSGKYVTHQLATERGESFAWLHRTAATLPYAAAGIALAALIGLLGYELRENRGASPVLMSEPRALAVKGADNEISSLSQERQSLREQLRERDSAIANLTGRTSRQLAEIQELKNEDQKTQDSLQRAQGGETEAAKARDELRHKLEQAQSDLGLMQTDVESLRQQRANEAARVAELEARLGQFPELLKDRDSTIEQQRELLARDRDIRDLMGARDLYIAEVFDVGRDGETKKPFGRVFYTKGKSLIFYAYDLDQQPGLREASTFQAWGRRGPDVTQAMDLGIFYADNTTHKRWVLKFDDPKSLDQIDAVFVTVEPKGGSRKPSGKQLLFAYLRVEPNHP
jgi:hypothetical protein